VFIGVLPLLGGGSLRAALGCFLCLLVAVFTREASPFIRPTTNLLSVVAAYQLLGTFMAALALASQSLHVFHLDDFTLGYEEEFLVLRPKHAHESHTNESLTEITHRNHAWVEKRGANMSRYHRRMTYIYIVFFVNIISLSLLRDSLTSLDIVCVIVSSFWSSERPNQQQQGLSVGAQLFHRRPVGSLVRGAAKERASDGAVAQATQRRGLGHLEQNHAIGSTRSSDNFSSACESC